MLIYLINNIKHYMVIKYFLQNKIIYFYYYIIFDFTQKNRVYIKYYKYFNRIFVLNLSVTVKIKWNWGDNISTS